MDASSGQGTHTVDFSAYQGSGHTYTLEVDGKASLPFDLDPKAYRQLAIDAMSFYYPQRSGIAIDDKMPPATAAPPATPPTPPTAATPRSRARPAPATTPWTSPAAGTTPATTASTSSTAASPSPQLMNQYERSPQASQDGTLRQPEAGNKTPDVLDEARWELDFLMKMQVPAGQKLAGMAHHKVPTSAGPGCRPTRPPTRSSACLKPPSTAATLNLAAAAAQGARVFEVYDKAYADKLLNVARTAFAAAQANPSSTRRTPTPPAAAPTATPTSTTSSTGPASELYITTGEKKFADFVTASPVHKSDVFANAFDWRAVGALGRLDLATVDNKLPDRERVRASVIAGADKHLATLNSQAYGQAYAPNGGYDWASNSQMLNNLAVSAPRST